MSSTIWNREVEEGLINFLNSFMLVKHGESKGEPITVKVRKPDSDFNTESYPIIYLQALTEKLNTVRTSSVPTVIERDIEKKQSIIEEPAMVFDLVYQIDFYTQTATEINEMTQAFLGNTHGGRYFNLPVKDQNGEDVNIFALRHGGTMTRHDYIDEERLFHSLITFTIFGELNEGIRTTKFIVTEPVGLNNQST